MTDPENPLLAASQWVRPGEPGLSACWENVVSGIERGWLSTEDVYEVITRLRAGHDIGFQGLSFDRLGNRLRVTNHDVEAWCPPEEMIRLLTTLIQGLPPSARDFPAIAVVWSHTGDGEFPYRAEAAGDELTIRVNDFPAEPPYTLIVNGRAHLDLEDWPPGWVRPEIPLPLAEGAQARRRPVPLDAGLLLEWAEMLCRFGSDDPTLVAPALGLPGELLPRRGEVALRPAPPGAAELVIGSRDGRFRYVKIMLATTTIIRADLDARLGAGYIPPRLHWDSPHTLVYRVEVPGAPYSCDVAADFYFTEEPKATATVLEVTLRRIPVYPLM
ncbi:hypothetical protein [Acrocarpospora catenulata]|uniref:hypothetical protein n=1 Tax=Acrocarpospora catenulata TaxID=2836182 RepID=UPI001BDA9674|nr:hypothetical protein [Acrocarpospora catenulata]